MPLRSRHRNAKTGRKKNLPVRVQFRKVRARQLRWIRSAAGVTVAVALIGLACWQGGAWALNKFVYQNESFTVRYLDFQNDGAISAARLRRWAGVSPDDNLLSIDLFEIKRNLELAPRIKSASVERVLPDTLQVRVAERTPRAQVWAWQRIPGLGLPGWVRFHIDADGFVQLPLRDGATVEADSLAEWDLPVISGLPLDQMIPGRLALSPKLHAALELIDVFDHSLLAGQVDMRVIDVSLPGILRVTTGDGAQVDMAPDRFCQQLSRWQPIRRHFDTFGIQVESLDLSVTNNVPARWKASPIVAELDPRSERLARN